MCGEGNGTPLRYFCLENPMDGGAWWAAVHGVAEGRTQLSDFTFTFHFHALEKEMATHSSVLAWRTPGTGEPGGLPSMGSHRVGHDCSDLAAAARELRVGFAGGSVVKNPSAMQETQVQFLGWEDLLQKEMSTHSSILAWKTPYTRESGGPQPMRPRKNQKQLSSSSKIAWKNTHLNIWPLIEA